MARGSGTRSEAGRGLVSLLVLLAILVGAGAWNYQRNAPEEDAGPRPFRGYTDEALEQLIDAYEGQQEQGSKRFEAAASRSVKVERKGYFADQVQEFERVQRISQNTRGLRAELAESQATLKLLREEVSTRARERQKLRRFLERVFTVRF